MLMALVGLLIVGSVSAQEAPWRLVQTSDGTLYVVAAGVRHRITPAALPDGVVAAISEGAAWEAGTLGDAPQPPVDTAAAGAPQAAAPLTFSGTTDVNTDLFWLDRTAYRVTWEVTPRARDGDCFFDADLKTPAGGRSHSLASPDVKVARTGETNVYDVRPGAHYLEVSTTCPSWRVTMAPR